MNTHFVIDVRFIVYNKETFYLRDTSPLPGSTFVYDLHTPLRSVHVHKWRPIILQSILKQRPTSFNLNDWLTTADTIVPPSASLSTAGHKIFHFSQRKICTYWLSFPAFIL
ncbi:hypothetical protein CDAR_75281 [Caerostris darwini]|uniref:Uncharacterized protein n=1 Tax=Caerostris darwini TaxID=1538125 RepID=A0AAV4QR54_9ARAC|nr:hypothetical protein CDAR_75281 [Caerostris darwini]